MEGCPKLPMFVYDLKIARESSNFSQVIKKLIRVSVCKNDSSVTLCPKLLEFSVTIQ